MINIMQNTTRYLTPGLLLLAGLVFSSAQAEEISYDHAAMLAGSCFNCHGTDGRYGEDSIPSIAGNSREVLLAQLQAFKRDETPDTTVMNRIAKGYSEAELKALADYFSSIRD
ncbi:MAG: cytochrome C [Ectothiorhodospiraceae bacterium]|nr:cytochrome C [Ectothiorhodospiraceae bacterium]